jgi:uroporphyrinogen decarboxylase
MTAAPDIAAAEARLGRFEERLRSAQLAAPPTRDLVKAAVHRRGAERCPVWLRRTTLDVVLRHGEAMSDLFDAHPDHLGRVAAYDFMVGWQKPGARKLPRPAEALLADSTWTDEWGVGWRHVGGSLGAVEVSHPLSDWGRLDEYVATGFPDPRAPGRLDAARAPAEAFRRKGVYSFGLIGPAFYQIFSIRGVENVLLDFIEHPDELARLVAALRDYELALIRGWAEVGVDALLFLDDWGTQKSLLMSPAMWRDFFKPGYAALFAETHRLGMDAFLHSCGQVTSIVEDLIEIGLDVIDPVQRVMDPEELARRFGGRISFCGTIDVQDLLPRATPGEVRDAIRRARDILGRPFGNALILAPTNTITPEVPLENLRAMFEAAHEP